MSGSSTRVYLRNVMQRVFPGKWSDHLRKLMSGDRATLDLCARHLEKNLDYFPLLHTLCLVTGRRFDLAPGDRFKAADAWVCWYDENKDRLAWDEKEERWTAKD